MTIRSASKTVSQSLATGFEAGAIAGFILLAFEGGVGAILGQTADVPARVAASLILGPSALSPFFPLPGPLVLGTTLFVVLGGGYGSIAAFTLNRSRRRPHPAVILAAGTLFGALIWIVNGLAVGPLLFPQTAVLDLMWQGFVAHAVFFGLALAGVFVLSERG